LELLQAAVEKELKGRLDDPMKNKYSMKALVDIIQESARGKADGKHGIQIGEGFERLVVEINKQPQS